VTGLVYVSVDMEGITGVATLDQITPGGRGYPAAQRMMTAEANAAVLGAFDAGAEAVTVNDSHGTMDNLLHEELDHRARLIVGSPKPDVMAEGLSAEFGVALLVGYHAAAGQPGVLAHTFSGAFTEVRLNGAVVSEAELTAQQAAAVGVPIGLVTGDDITCALAQVAFPGVRTVAVKTALGHTAADGLSPRQARDEIRRAAAAAVTAGLAGELPPVEPLDRLDLEVDLRTVIDAERAGAIPWVERVGSRTVRGTLPDPRAVMGLLGVLADLAS
jgi:D-amino peptidase